MSIVQGQRTAASAKDRPRLRMRRSVRTRGLDTSGLAQDPMGPFGLSIRSLADIQAEAEIQPAAAGRRGVVGWRSHVVVGWRRDVIRRRGRIVSLVPGLRSSSSADSQVRAPSRPLDRSRTTDSPNHGPSPPSVSAVAAGIVEAVMVAPVIPIVTVAPITPSVAAVAVAPATPAVTPVWGSVMPCVPAAPVGVSRAPQPQ